MDLSPVVERLLRIQGRIFDVRIVRGNEIHCHIGRGAVEELGGVLHAEYGADLSLLIAEDRRPADGMFAVHYLFINRGENWFVHATQGVSSSNPVIDSLAVFHYPASRFEREIFDLFGIRAEGHPDPRPLVRHAFWPEDYFPLRKDAARREFDDDGSPFPFAEVRGEGVYEIPVGPVHAGVIEPGHFRFSVLGETVIDLKSRLYFTHKGTEKLFEGRTPADALPLAERAYSAANGSPMTADTISGDSTVAHVLAFCQAVEALASTPVPERARYLRVILLELERLYNHVGDFGAIVNDTGFPAAHMHCLRIREKLLRLNKRLTGSRLLRGGIVPGGVAIDLPAGLDVVGEVKAAVTDFEEVASITLANTLVMDRLEGTGRLTLKTARDHGVLGYIARASGLDVDARRDHPFAAYSELEFTVPVLTSGDVKARTLVRVEEIRQSVSLISQAVERIPAGTLRKEPGPADSDRPAFGIVEGWRGAIVHWIRVDDRQRLERVKVLDPSFLNWRPLSYAMLENIVPDFPLCNKSFNQSYSGNDL
jgi:Ni,Fe-hydrogenase III large subunit/Ni,Fe-hydrogenase III component G